MPRKKYLLDACPRNANREAKVEADYAELGRVFTEGVSSHRFGESVLLAPAHMVRGVFLPESGSYSKTFGSRSNIGAVLAKGMQSGDIRPNQMEQIKPVGFFSSLGTIGKGCWQSIKRGDIFAKPSYWWKGKPSPPTIVGTLLRNTVTFGLAAYLQARDKRRALHTAHLAQDAAQIYDLLKYTARPFSPGAIQLSRLEEGLHTQAYLRYSEDELGVTLEEEQQQQPAGVVEVKAEEILYPEGPVQNPISGDERDAEHARNLRTRLENLTTAHTHELSRRLEGVTDPEDIEKVHTEWKQDRDDALYRARLRDAYFEIDKNGKVNYSKVRKSIREAEDGYKDVNAVDAALQAGTLEMTLNGTALEDTTRQMTQFSDRAVNEVIDTRVQYLEEAVKTHLGLEKPEPLEQGASYEKQQEYQEQMRAYVDNADRKKLCEQHAIMCQVAACAGIPEVANLPFDEARQTVADKMEDIDRKLMEDLKKEHGDTIQCTTNTENGTVSIAFSGGKKDKATVDQFLRALKVKLLHMMATCKNPPLKSVDLKIMSEHPQFGGEIAYHAQQMCAGMGLHANFTDIGPSASSASAKMHSELLLSKQREGKKAQVNQVANQTKEHIKAVENARSKVEAEPSAQNLQALAEATRALSESCQQCGRYSGMLRSEAGGGKSEDGSARPFLDSDEQKTTDRAYDAYVKGREALQQVDQTMSDMQVAEESDEHRICQQIDATLAEVNRAVEISPQADPVRADASYRAAPAA